MSKDKKIYKVIKTNKPADCQVEVVAEMSDADLAPYKEKALKKLKEIVELPGFRKGNVPEKMILEKVGDLGLLEEACELAINDCVTDIIIECAPAFLGRPEISISKIAIGSPIEFKVSIATMPEIKIGDYKKIAKNINKKEEKIEEVKEEDVKKAIEEIQKMVASSTPKGADGKDAPVPEVNEEFIKKLGDFKSVDDFKAKVKEGIIKEREQKAKDKKRLEMIEEIIKKSKIELPKVLIEDELNKMQMQFEDDIKKAGIKSDDYLKHIKKNWDDLRKEWTGSAKQRVETQVMFHEIARIEKIEPSKEDVEKETKHLLSHYKDAVEDRARAYVEMMLVNNLVIKFLDEQI